MKKARIILVGFILGLALASSPAYGISQTVISECLK